ncbi:MAP kinase-interacting serine/threonine-protein kinase 1 [Gossypium arboreum]|uniref:MAP kinase-interacting serine/threonine-protein kinase 1 n=1 Tax=Gossypium arboreum TaxID=29729 RepID=A0A0B0N5L3_GOSAR|nr:MAP kinase-interacting serine/threonine-protein kinase 1 [Gossypium arboreum]
MLHGRVSLGAGIKMKSACSTQYHTRSCDWPCGTSQYSPNLAHGLAHGIDTQTCGWPCDPSQYTLQFSKNLAHGLIFGRVMQVNMYALFLHGLRHGRVY